MPQQNQMLCHWAILQYHPRTCVRWGGACNKPLGVWGVSQVLLPGQARGMWLLVPVGAHRRDSAQHRCVHTVWTAMGTQLCRGSAAPVRLHT